MKSRSKELLDRAISGMIAAIEIYNKPSFPYRSETFAILSINAWELVLKSKWLSMHNNRERSLYVYDSKKKGDGKNTKKKYIRRTTSGNPFTLSIDKLAKKMVEEKILDLKAWGNLRALQELRDSAIHFYNNLPSFRIRLQEIGTACVKNFAAVVQDWFERDLSEFRLHIMPLSLVDLPDNCDGLLLNAEEKNFLKFIESLDNHKDDPNERYSVTVNIEIKFTKSKANNAFLAKITNDPSAPPIRMTEEQIRDRYPWDYALLTEKCQYRYSDFKVDKKYHSKRKELQDNPGFMAIRYLDPGNLKSQKKTFFNPNILTELDKIYTKKS